MAAYLAHYRSPNADANRARGTFVFESDARANTKQNTHDARIAMLELFGAEAVSWVIESVEKQKGAPAAISDGQLEFDFREPVKRTRKTRTVERGRV